MQCPNCEATLLMTDRQGIEMDYCPQCRGVWVDRGELDKLIDRATQESVATQQAARPAHPEAYRDERHDERHDDRHQGRYTKKKNIWGEIFDF